MIVLFSLCWGYGVNFLSYLLYPLLHLRLQATRTLFNVNEYLTTHRDQQTTIEHLCAENEQLLEANIALRAQLSLLKDIQDLYEFNKRYDEDTHCIAQVLGVISTTQEHSMLISFGSSHGISKDMIVIHHNILVGKVVEVFPLYSRVMLLSDPHCKVPVYCEQTNVQGVHEGAGKTGMVRFVHFLEEVKMGDAIFSSGSGLLFPRGFLIGTIVKVEKKNLYYEITTQFACDSEQLRYCTVLTKKHS